MGEKLKNCPFCDAPAKRITIGKEEYYNTGGDVIVCTRCQASSHVEFGRKENLVDRWNARTRGEDARLREALEHVIEFADQQRDFAMANLRVEHRPAHYTGFREACITIGLVARAALQGDAAHTSQEKGNG